MKKIRHKETGIIIDIDQIEESSNCDERILLGTRFEPNNSDFVRIENYSFDFGLRSLSEFESLDNQFDINELKELHDAIMLKEYYGKGSNLSINIIEKLRLLINQAIL